MFIKLHRIQKTNDRYYLSEIVINTIHISFLSENREYKMALTEGKMDIELSKHADFSDVFINKAGKQEVITVIGNIGFVESKINKSRKQLLRG